MEYLRKEELEKEVDKDPVDAITQYDVEIEEGDEPETKEAWKLPQEKKYKLGLNVAMLMVIGKLHFLCSICDLITIILLI